jgi:hypothetical protein
MGSGDGQSVDLLSYKDCSDMEVSYKMPQDSDSIAFGDFFEMDQEWEGWLQL